MLQSLIVITFSLTFTAALHCDITGKCTNSNLVGFDKKNSSTECLKFCKSLNNCQWYTFNTETNSCEGFANCKVFSSKIFPNCLTGQVNCMEDADCFQKSLCIEEATSVSEEDASEDCLLRCRRTKDCQWFNFNHGLCLTLNSCDTIDESCDSCLSGPATCKGN